MRKAFLTALSLSLFLLLFYGCGKSEGELQGSIFIVTNGAQNIKLGLVKVTAIPENEILQYVESKKKVVNSESSKLKSDIDLIKPEVEKYQREYDEAKRNYDSIVSQRDSLKSSEQSLNLSFNPYLLNENPYFSEYETPEQKAERNKQKQIQKQLESVRKQIVGFEPKIAQANKLMLDVQTRLNAAKTRLSTLNDKIYSYLNEDFLLDSLPQGKIKAVTDADGKFTMKLPTGKYALFATSQRRVVDTTEEYFWLVWVEIDGKELKQTTLSNQNMIGQDSEDSVFKFKELVPSSDSPAKDGNTIKFNT